MRYAEQLARSRKTFPILLKASVVALLLLRLAGQTRNSAASRSAASSAAACERYHFGAGLACRADGRQCTLDIDPSPSAATKISDLRHPVSNNKADRCGRAVARLSFRFPSSIDLQCVGELRNLRLRRESVLSVTPFSKWHALRGVCQD